jgi:hypothetical protein
MNTATPNNEPVSSLRWILSGAWRFALVSLVAFSVWAFGGKLFRGIGGEPTMYAAIAIVFMGFSGLALSPLAPGPRPFLRFYSVFVPSFLAYAAVWSGLWFALGFGSGEWLASLAGSLVFVAIACWRLATWPIFWRTALLFFIVHTAGYFAGGWSMAHFIQQSRHAEGTALSKHQWVVLAQLSWGLFYGLGFGAGLGALFHRVRTSLSHAENR